MDSCLPLIIDCVAPETGKNKDPQYGQSKNLAIYLQGGHEEHEDGVRARRITNILQGRRAKTNRCIMTKAKGVESDHRFMVLSAPSPRV